MSRHFASPSEPWFHLGRLEVNTVTLVGLTGVLSAVVGLIVPELSFWLFFHPQLVAGGELWRVVTWPWANDLWVVLTALMLWYFGSELERIVGRLRMAWILVGTWGSLTLASSAVSLIPGLSGSSLAGLNLIELAVLLIWIAEYPTRPFFFGIPAWVFGVIIVALQALSLVRAPGALLSLVLSLVFVAMMARRFGLLSAYDWIPGKPATVKASSVRRSRVPRGTARQEERRKSDREQLDALLDQINDHGIQSLTDYQRKELLRLRDRLRRN